MYSLYSVLALQSSDHTTVVSQTQIILPHPLDVLFLNNAMSSVEYPLHFVLAVRLNIFC